MKKQRLILNNATKKTYKNDFCEVVLIVLSGEVDITAGGVLRRLNKGSWINIPEKITCKMHTYRSVGPCEILIVETEKAMCNKTICTCNFFDMPQRDGKVFFAWETGSIIGCIEKGENGIDTIGNNDDTFSLEFLDDVSVGLRYEDWLNEKYGILWSEGYQIVNRRTKV